MPRYGVKYRTTQEGYTGGITDKLSLARAYAHKTGTTYEVGAPGDPELTTTKPTEPQEEDFSDLC